MKWIANSLVMFLVFALLSFSITPLSAQPKPFSIPQDPVAAYFQVVVVPAWSGTALNEKDVGNFYRTYVSFYSQAKVAEDQFIAHWQNVAKEVSSGRFWAAFWTGTKFGLTYDIGEPVYNEAKDQARFKVTVTITSSRTQLFGSSQTQDNRIVFVQVIKEEATWKIVLNDDLVAEMQKLPTKQAAKRYAIGREMVQGGLRLAVLTLSIDKDTTTLEVVVENRTDQGADLFNALSAATLRDELGNVYAARVLRSTMSPDVGSRQTATGILVFAGIPPNTKSVVLTIPDAKIGTDTVTFTVEISLVP